MTETTPMTLSELRSSCGFTVREVARRMGVPHPTVIRFEAHGGGNLDTIEKYAEALERGFAEVHLASQETRRRRSSLTAV